MHPEIYQDIMRIGNLRLRDNLLKQTVQDFDKTHVRETIQYTVATDDTPWKNWKNKVNLMAYMRFDARKRGKFIVMGIHSVSPSEQIIHYGIGFGIGVFRRLHVVNTQMSHNKTKPTK